MVLLAASGKIQMNVIMFRVLILVLVVLSRLAQAQGTVAEKFSDNMVLQRNKPIHLWGKSAPRKIVTASLGKESASVITLSDSSWHIYLPGQQANALPQQLKISIENSTRVLNNILIGDVWLCLVKATCMANALYW